MGMVVMMINRALLTAKQRSRIPVDMVVVVMKEVVVNISKENLASYSTADIILIQRCLAYTMLLEALQHITLN